MKDIEFPLFKTKGSSKKYDLTDVEQRKEYFQEKAGKEIDMLRKHLKKNTFIAYMLGKKNSGKGTFAKLFKEIVDPDTIEHFSIGDMVRDFEQELKKNKKQSEEFLKKNYRGYVSLKDTLKSLKDRSTKHLLSSELVLTLVKREIAKRGKKSLLIDGFPRGLDQVSYSIFFRDLIDYREDPDVFMLLDVPEAVIDVRIKNRRVCPKCQNSRNLKVFPTKEVGHDKDFFLMCDNPGCKKARLQAKEGDEHGIELIRDRLDRDEELIKKAFDLHGIPNVLLRNAIPVSKAKEYVDNYEITPAYSFKKGEKIETIESPWVFKDDNGIDSYSLMPPPIVVSMIKQLVKVLKI